MKKTRPLAKAILLSLFLALFTLNSYAQKVSLSFQNETFEKVLNSIKQQTGLSLVFSEQLVNLNRKVSIKVNSIEVEDALKQLLTGTNLSYEIKNNKLYLVEKKNVEPQISPNQSKKITGLVTDEKGDPIIGASIVLKGSNTGTITNIDGEFALDVQNQSEIIISYIGFRQTVLVVGKTSNYKIILEEDSKALEEVVVVGYGVMKKLDITGSVGVVNGNEMLKMSTGSTINTLVGKMPGIITKQTSGEPGKDNSSLNIRGFGAPLVIIDGVERPLAEFNAMDPNEIESVSVLKDASAAIYGARSGNGVVLITTKRGSIGKPVFQLSSSYSIQQTTSTLKPLSSYQYAILQNEAAFNDGSPLIWKEEEIELFRNGTDTNYPNTDWFNIALRENTPQHQHNLSMRGGSDKIKYFGTLGMLEQEYFYSTGDSKYSKFNIRSNIDAEITKNLSASLDFSFVNRNTISPQQESELFFEGLYTYAPIYPAFYPDKTKIPQILGVTDSPWANINLDIGGYNKTAVTNTNLSGTLKYDFPFLKGLSAKFFGSYRDVVTRTKSWDKYYKTYQYDKVSDVYTVAGGSAPTRLNQGFNYNKYLTAQTSISYEQTFGKHELSGLALYEWMDNKSENINGSKQNFLTNSIDYLFAGGSDNQVVTGTASEFGRTSFVSRLNYNYDKRYLLQLSFRADASPKFAKDLRWGYFPSLSLGWRLSEESFMSSIKALDNLKLRASYGNTGYDATGDYQYLTGYQYTKGLDNSYLINGAPISGLVSTGLTNENITWEEMTTYNIGIDYSFWKSRLYGEIDVFYRERNGMLASRIGSLPNTFGAALPDENINSQNNRGFEFKIGTKGKINDFHYDIEGYVSWARTKWNHYEEPNYEDEDNIKINKKSGNWVNRLFGYQDAGLFTSQEEINNYGIDIDGQNNATIKPGYVKWIDQNNDSIINWKDQVEIGLGSAPEVYMGLTTNFQYKGLDLSILFQGATRTTVQLPAERAIGTYSASIAFDPNRWTVENNKSEARFPARSLSLNTNTKLNSERWTVDGSYLRLKNLQIGYSFSKKVLKKTGIDNLRFYISGTNLLTLSKISDWDYDPEYPATDFRGQNFRGFYYPVQRLYTFGANINF